MLGTDPAAAADDLRTLLPPAQRAPRVLRATDVALVTPTRGGQVAEVRVDAERQIREVPQPGDHPLDVVGRDAVDQQRPHAELLEAQRGATERVALRPAPVLAVNAADTVTTATEARPHRQPGRHQRLDRRVCRVAHERERLEQDQVRRLVLERPAEQPDRLLAVGRVDVPVEAERDRHLVPAAGVLRGGPGEPHRTPRDVHPVHRDLALPQPGAAVAERGRQPPGGGGDHVAAGLGVAAVDRRDLAGAVEQRADAPESVLDVRAVARDLDQLAPDRPVEQHAGVGGEQPLDPVVAPRGRYAESLLVADGVCHHALEPASTAVRSRRAPAYSSPRGSGPAPAGSSS
jgi:hypothetical protein